MATNLADFLKTKGLNVVVQTPKVIGGAENAISLVQNFGSQTSTPQVTAEANAITQPLRWLGKQLMKPVGVTAKITEKVGQAIGTQTTTPLKEVPKEAGQILTGKKEYSFSQLWRENLPEHPVAGTIIGTVIDITADPLTYLGGGLTKTGILAKKATSLAKAGETIAEGSKLARQIEKAGLTAEELALGATKVEQAVKGQRAFLTLAGRSALPTKLNEVIYKATGKLGGLAKTPAVQGLKGLVSTKTENQSFDAILEHYKSLGDYRRARILEEARNIQKEVQKLKPEEVIRVSNYLEKGTRSSERVNQIGEKLKTAYADFKALEKELGVTGGELAEYAPHLKAKTPLKESVKNFFSARQWTGKLGGAEKGRQILKFTANDGTEIIGKAEQLKLKPIISGYKDRFGNITKEYRVGSVPVVEGFKDSTGKLFQSSQASIEEINQAFNKKFFEENPAIQYAYRGMAHAKATTGKEFLENVKQFAVKEGIESTAPELKGLKFAPEIARTIDTYKQGLKPEELKLIFRTFDAVQNWWKGQALIAPSYHLRNSVSNLWNNFLAGLKDPVAYIRSGEIQMGKGKMVNFVDDAGRAWTGDKILENAKRTGVVNEGWYAADIPTSIGAEINKGWKQGINPLSQQNYAFRLNKKIGTAIENNARLAHFIDKLKKGYSVDDAAMSVKKYLFNYNDLTNFEKTVMKRVMPFYTWTRKNIPLQLEHLIKEPGKFAGLEKGVKAVEQIGMGNTTPANEKYLNDYIKNNTAMRVKYNADNKTYYYFLLGNWMPSYQMMDFLSQPLQNMMQMLTPIVKTPMELMANKSSFFKNTLGEASIIENYPGETTNFLGFNVSKKTAMILRNIRLLNEIDKLNPGKIFGGKKGEPSIFKGLPVVSVPGLGTISPATMKYKGTTPQPSVAERTMGFITGKLQGYNVRNAREYYQKETQDRIDELKYAIKRAAQARDTERVKVLNQQLKDFVKSR